MTKAQMTRVAVNGYGVIANESIVRHEHRARDRNLLDVIGAPE